MASLKQPQGLRQYLNVLQRTIVDVMGVVKATGERYLWVDSLVSGHGSRRRLSLSPLNRATTFADVCRSLSASCRNRHLRLPSKSPPWTACTAARWSLSWRPAAKKKSQKGGGEGYKTPVPTSPIHPPALPHIFVPKNRSRELCFSSFAVRTASFLIIPSERDGGAPLDMSHSDHCKWQPIDGRILA